MSITKRLSVKAAKPQDQTSECKQRKLIEAILDEKTTELSDAIDSAVYNSIMHGTGSVKIGGFIATTPPYTGHSLATAIGRTSSNPGWPRAVDLKKEMLEVHPAFELTVEQLRAAWMLAYGSRWVDMNQIYDDDYMEKVATRLRVLGELEVHHVIDQYSPMARIKI